MNKVDKLFNKKQSHEKYKEINDIYQKMKDENGNRAPSLKECVSILKRIYRWKMKRVMPKYYKFEETSGIRHSWCRYSTWKFNVNDPDAEYQWHNYWRNIIHAISHWIEYRKFGNEARIHNLDSFIMEKSIAKYIYERKWHMGTLVRKTKPKPVIDKNTLMINRLKKNISSWKTKIKRADTYISKYEKQLKYYEKKVSKMESAIAYN